MKDVIFRFYEYEFGIDEAKSGDSKFIAAFRADENFGDFVQMFNNLVGNDIKLKGDWYTVGEVASSFGGDSEDAFCVDIYCHL